MKQLFLFSILFLGTILVQSQNTSDSALTTLKEEAKGLLYNDPLKAYDLFNQLEEQSRAFFEKKLISQKTYDEFSGDANSGKGNYHLISTGNVDSAFYFYDQSIQHYQAAKDLQGIGSIYNNKGVVLEQLNLQDSALQSYDSALYYYLLNNDLKRCAKTYGNIGNIYIDKGNFPLAQSYYLKSFDCALQIKDTLELAYTYFGLGNIAKYTKHIGEAEHYYQNALKAFKKTDDLYGLSSAYFSMANIFKEQLKIDSAYFLYHHTLGIFKKSGYLAALPQCHINIAVIFNEYYDSIVNFSGQFDESKAPAIIKVIEKVGLDSAMYHAKEAIRISKEVSKYYTLVYGYVAMGSSENLLKHFKQALKYADSAYSYVKDGEYVYEMEQIGLLKYRSYKGLNQHKEALKWYEIYVDIKDSLYNLDKAEELLQQKFQFDYEKKTANDSILHEAEMKKNIALEQAKMKKNVALEKAKTEQQKTRNIYLSLIALVLLILGIVIFQRLKITQKQKKIIDEQKREVESQKGQIELQHHQLEETHKEISDSIRYAQRLQGAILPDMNDLNSTLKNSFILFQPKDIVSGDFYWMQTIQDGVLLAAADCTGHGVPGAMVSVVCSNALNRSVKEFNLSEPAEILNKTRELVIETFASNTADVKDGMDIALCKIVFTEVGANLSFSGANNPLWILRENANEIEEIKGDKQPIGKYENQRAFTQHNVTLNANDSFYIFSDGYADQFGGEKGKKMKLKPFKDLLTLIKNNAMDVQKNELLSRFNKWKGDFEQVDDVTVIGVKIS